MEKQTKLKAALYIRVSTEEQALDGQSAPAQEETLKQYCHAFGIEVADVYMDLGLSGRSLKERCGLRRLIDDCRRRSFDMVLVWKISRLSRNLKDLLYLIDVFERNDVHFASCSEKFDTSTPVGRMTLQLLGSIAEFERNTIVENVKLGLKEFARKGGKATSLLGYDNVGKSLVVNEREAGIVKKIFSLYTDSGMSFSEIAQQLNSLGYRTKRGSEFRSSSIAYVLNNPAYIGINRHGINTENEYCVDGTHPAIIDEEAWHKAQSINPRSKKRNAGTCVDQVPFKAICMQCNSPMKVFYAYSKGRKYKYLRCSSCSNYINVERLEKEAAQAMLEIINDSSKHAALMSLIDNSTENAHAGMEISSIAFEISRLEKSRSRYLSLFESFKLSDSKVFIERIDEIEGQIKNLKKKRLELVNEAARILQTDYDSYLGSLRVRLETAESSAVKQLAGCLINRIEVFKGEISFVLYL